MRRRTRIAVLLAILLFTAFGFRLVPAHTSHFAAFQAATSSTVTEAETSQKQQAPRSQASTSSTETASIKETATSTAKQAKPTTVISRATKSPASSPATSSSETQASRITQPYSFPPETASQVNSSARAALVNILCSSNGSLNPTSGSGVIIDPKGVILTNAHVAQYVLLSESPAFNLSCTIRSGSPARNTWRAEVMFLPPIWVHEHAAEINLAHPTGTGEHDYALLRITGTTDGSALPSTFPYLPIDTREAIGFPGDQVLVASYPAEFVGGIQTTYGLYAASSVTTIQKLMTFASSTADVDSLGGIIEAQGGSSGGAEVNVWGRLIGLITTTSSGTTTANRDLHATTLSYINRDIAMQSGKTLAQLLSDPAGTEVAFNADFATSLVQLYISALKL